jgi:uncharacterized protein
MRNLVLGVLLLAFITGAATAQGGYPTQRDPYINDYADLLNDEQEARISAMLTALQDADGIELVVVTVDSYTDYTTRATTFERFATGLFNAWGIDDAASNDGILFLTAVDDRRVRIEVGDGYGVGLDDRVDDVIDETITPAYRRGDYAGGIEEGVIDIMRVVTGGTPAAAAPRTDLSGLLPFAVIMVVIGAIAWVYQKAAQWGDGYGTDDGYFDADGMQADGYNTRYYGSDAAQTDSVEAPAFWGNGDGERVWNWDTNYHSDDSDNHSSWSSSRSSSSSTRSSSRSSGSRGSSSGGGASGKW